MSISRKLSRFAAVPLMTQALATAVPPPAVQAYDDDRYGDHEPYAQRRSSYNDEYIFAATRGVTDMDAPPYVKVPLIPLTIVLDVAILPFEIIAGVF